jgi:hypothetical protein
VKIYAIPGQHDVYGYDSLWKGSPLYVLRDKIELYKQPVNIMIDDVRVRVLPIRKDFNLDDYKQDVDIILTHDMIADQKLPFDCILYSDIETNVPIIVGSDYHKPFVMKTEKTVFISPGCLVRQTIAEKDYPLNFYIIDTVRRELEMTPVVYKQDVFNEPKVSQIEKSVNQMKFDFKISIEEALKILIANKSKEVKEECLERFQIASNNFKTSERI